MYNVKITDNGYNAVELWPMMRTFETAVRVYFPTAEVRHFYYGDTLDMVDVVLSNGNYAHFNLSKNRVSLNGYTASHNELEAFKNLTYNDECYDGKLPDIITEAWMQAEPMRDFHDAHKGEKYSEYMKGIYAIDLRQEAYVDRTLYTDGNLHFWEECYSIGD